MIKIKIEIDRDRIREIKEGLFKKIMLKRAYKGYCKFLECENITPYSYCKFRSFEYWKVYLAFRQYFAWCRGDDFNTHHDNFKSLILNISSKKK